MRELGPDRVSEDGRRLVLREASSGETFTVPIDRLRPFLDRASAGSTGAPAEQETTMESTLSPREIQTRVRRGESAEQVAEASGMSLAAVEPFAAPVVAEREYMVEQARRTTIRRRHVGGSGVALGLAVDERLADGGHVPEDTTWDAWRREDGRWTVIATTPAAVLPATFLFDVKGRYVLPADDTAHDLVGDVALPESTDMAIADAVRDAAEPAQADVETAPAPEAPVTAAEIVEAQTAQAQTGLDQPALVDDVPHAPVSSLQEARDRRALEAEAQAEARAAQTPGQHKASEGQHPQQDSLDDLFEEAEEQHVAVPDTVAPRSRKKNERRRVPSWDEIMFGGRED